MSIDKDKKKIQFKIVEIKKVSYFEKDPSEYGFNMGDLETVNVNIGLNLEIHRKEESISFKMKVDFIKDNKDLFGIESLYKFKIKDFDKTFISTDDNIKIPDPIMVTFLMIAISGTRGMLAALTTFPAYKNIYLPIISEPINILKEIINKGNDPKVNNARVDVAKK